MALLAYGLLDVLSNGSRAIAGWNVGAATYLALAWLTIAGADSDATRLSTQSMRQSGFVVLWVVVLAAFITVSSLAFLFQTAKGETLALILLHTGMTLLALGLSWLLIHTRFAFHYAHCYYTVCRNNQSTDGGLDFPGEREPDYLGFAYFSFVIGMTSQVSDVVITSRSMRRLTLAHSLLAFGFNVVVFAMSVNIFASLVIQPLQLEVNWRPHGVANLSPVL